MPSCETVTVSEFLKEHPATAKIPKLYTGSWIDSNLETWIGETEENRAWDYLAKARRTLADYTQEAAARKLDAKERTRLRKRGMSFTQPKAVIGSGGTGMTRIPGKIMPLTSFPDSFAECLPYIGRRCRDTFTCRSSEGACSAQCEDEDFTREMEVDGIIQAGEWNEALSTSSRRLQRSPAGGDDILRALWLGVDAETSTFV